MEKYKTSVKVDVQTRALTEVILGESIRIIYKKFGVGYSKTNPKIANSFLLAYSTNLQTSNSI